MPFTSLGLSHKLLQAITEQGYTEPTAVQKQAVPLILEGGDAMIGSQTGTGKTAGFTWPMLQRLSVTNRGGGRKPVRALILTPTRELAAQVGKSVQTYGRYTGLKSTLIFGGVSIGPQIKQLRAGIDIIIATPGRLLDHVNQRTVDLSAVEIVVLDEADRMLDMGFIHDIRKILSLLPEHKQSLLFSATFSPEIKGLAKNFLKNPKVIEATQNNTIAENITQIVHPVDNKNKTALLEEIINAGSWAQVLVFTATKHGANKLTEKLEGAGITATAIHGNKSQAARAKALRDFKQGHVRVLVATDVAARGLDINHLPHVVNFDLPQVAEDYVHRIGRTGRAGNAGTAISLVSVDDHKLLKDIERLLKQPLPQVVIPGFEPDPTIRANPMTRGRRGGGGGRDQRPAKRSFGDRRPSGNRSFGERFFEGRASSDRPASDRSFGERSSGNRSFGDRPADRKPFGERSSDDRGFGARSSGERSFGDRPASERTYGDRPSSERTYGDRPASERTYGDRPASKKSFGERSSSPGKRPFGSRPFKHGPKKPGGFSSQKKRNG